MHPLERVTRFCPTLRDSYSPLLRATGEAIGRRPNPSALKALPGAAGAAVLIVDDTMTSGANVQSAAAGLTAAGATVIAAVVIGRLVDTADAERPEKEEYWKRQRARRFSFDVCCLE